MVFFPCFIVFATVLFINPFDFTLFITSSNRLDTLSIIPPLFIACCACEIFSKFPVTIPIALFPRFIASSILFFIPSFKPYSIRLSFNSII